CSAAVRGPPGGLWFRSARGSWTVLFSPLRPPWRLPHRRHFHRRSVSQLRHLSAAVQSLGNHCAAAERSHPVVPISATPVENPVGKSPEKGKNTRRDWGLVHFAQNLVHSP